MRGVATTKCLLPTAILNRLPQEISLEVYLEVGCVGGEAPYALDPRRHQAFRYCLQVPPPRVSSVDLDVSTGVDELVNHILQKLKTHEHLLVPKFTNARAQNLLAAQPTCLSLRRIQGEVSVYRNLQTLSGAVDPMASSTASTIRSSSRTSSS
jgi:hypothetical protein